MTEVEVLEAAKKVIEDNNWIKFSFAKDAKGNILCTDNPTATCFCVVGAIHRAAPSKVVGDRVVVINALGKMHRAASILTNKQYVWASSYNDYVANSKEDIYKLFDKAIELAKEVK